MIFAIIACEVGFWILLGLGILARYPLGMPKLGMAFFYATPVVDLLLLAFVVIHLRGGAEPHFTHGLAALYIGFSVAFGHKSIAAVDRAYRTKVLKQEMEPLAKSAPYIEELKLLGRAVLAAVTAVIVLEVAIFFANNSAAGDLRSWYGRIGIALFIWAIVGPLWALFSKDKPHNTVAAAS